MFEKLLSEQGLSIERLHALVQLNECGSLIKAAGNDKGKQSRYSHYMRELSVFFGVELTTRVGKIVQLTPAGKGLAQIAQEHFQSLQQFRQNVRSQPRDFRIGAEDGLLQWLVIPTVGKLRRADHPFRLVLQSLEETVTVDMLVAQRLDFGLVRANVVPAVLKRVQVCTLRHAVVVPERLVPQRGLLTLKGALLDCPHAVVRTDDQMTQRINELAQSMDGQFQPALICDSVSHRVTAVRSGYYAAVLPLQSWKTDSHMPCHVVEGPSLGSLDKAVALAWHPRLMEVGGRVTSRMREILVAALKQTDSIE
jgi:DNA-binding transcriptional LysR family regulator